MTTLLTSTFWANARTFGLVTLVTILIWVWADAETQGGRNDLLQGGPNLTGKSVEEAEFTVETLPVMIAFGADLGGLQWGRVRPQETELKRITIAGPAAVIERIKAGGGRGGDATLKLSALLVLDDQDWGAGIVSKGVELSPGGLGLRFVGPAPTVRVTISR